jgi:predicted phosphodiesterase
MAAMRIKLCSDIHGAADLLARRAAGADALLVCGDLVNLIDYRTMEGIAVEVFGREVTADFARHRTAGRFEEAGRVLRSASEGREDQVHEQVRSTRRCSPPSPSPPT